MPPEIVDTQSAQELMREALAKVSAWELDAIEAECADKHRRVRALLGRGAPPDEEEIRRLLRSIFATRRRASALLAAVGAAPLGRRLHALVAGTEPVEARVAAFVDGLGAAGATAAADLAGECLHWTDPARYWLWTRWVWDPGTRTGALPLVTTGACDLDGGSPGATYLKVGEATALVHRVGQAAGFTRIGQGGFGVDVYLACVYGVYVYTAVRLRITQEFNRVIPPLPELCRRLLGVWKMEV